jgi:hypothetical protein
MRILFAMTNGIITFISKIYYFQISIDRKYKIISLKNYRFIKYNYNIFNLIYIYIYIYIK